MPDFSPLWISLKTATIALIIIFFLGIAAAYWMLVGLKQISSPNKA
ncbi:hypothetical protein [Microcystis aeruginosa]|nr:hypothetical protein [Microcystis aeruginosa]